MKPIFLVLQFGGVWTHQVFFIWFLLWRFLFTSCHRDRTENVRKSRRISILDSCLLLLSSCLLSHLALKTTLKFKMSPYFLFQWQRSNRERDMAQQGHRQQKNLTEVLPVHTLSMTKNNYYILTEYHNVYCCLEALKTHIYNKYLPK